MIIVWETKKSYVNEETASHSIAEIIINLNSNLCSNTQAKTFNQAID